MINSRAFIRTIQDFCLRMGYNKKCIEFSNVVTNESINLIKKNNFTFHGFNKIIRRQKQFIDFNLIYKLPDFSKDLYKEIFDLIIDSIIDNIENLNEVLLRFKKFMEATGYAAFQVEKPKEELGRTLLEAFLKEEVFREPILSGGKCDLIVPSCKTIIETKIWRDEQAYLDGFAELDSYLAAKDYVEGFYILFDKTRGYNKVTKTMQSDIFEKNFNKKKIRVIFIKINPLQPSLIRKKSIRKTN